MKYTLKVELEVGIEFLNIDVLDEDAKEEIESIVVETLSDNSYEITKNIFVSSLPGMFRVCIHLQQFKK